MPKAKKTKRMAEGHIRQRGKTSWQIKFDGPPDPETGNRRIQYVTVRGSKKDAQRERRRLLDAVEGGSYVQPSKVTVNEFASRWKQEWAAFNVSPRTAERYGELLDHHVIPHIGSLSVQRVGPMALNKLYADLLTTGRTLHSGEVIGLAPRTVGHVHRAIHRMLGFAVQWGVIEINPASKVSPPKVEPTEIEILTNEQATVVLTKLRGRVLYPVVAMALASGMRRGEILALRWRVVDFQKRTVRVESALEETKAGGVRVKAPKTKHGKRNISLPDWMFDVLRDQRRQHQERNLALGLGKLTGDEWVFGKLDGDVRAPESVTKEWRATVRTMQLPDVTFHALRHTHASQLIAAGLDVLTISRRLGHARPTITLDVYGHLFADSDVKAAQVMHDIFSGHGAD